MNLHILGGTAAKARGVIGLKNIGDDDLFVFLDTYEGAGFHMRNVPFNISIAYLDKDYGILSIDKMLTEVGTSYAPADSVLAVEATADYFERNGLRVDMVWKALANRAQNGELSAHLRI